MKQRGPHQAGGLPVRANVPPPRRPRCLGLAWSMHLPSSGPSQGPWVSLPGAAYSGHSPGGLSISICQMDGLVETPLSWP